jgi:hypothetical protein
MVKYPVTVSAQQIVLAPLQTLLSQMPFCEAFRTFVAQVEDDWSEWAPGALESIAQISTSMATVFDYLHTSTDQSIDSSQYLLTLSNAARRLSVNARLASVVTTGSQTFNVPQSAQNALSTLSAWDAAQGYAAPPNYAALANALMNGVVVVR